jgi:hypothetical protein
MEASMVQLRHNTRDVMKALNRNEQVKILYHGKLKGILIPYRPPRRLRITDHPYFGMSRRARQPVPHQVNRLRTPRYHAL